MSGLNSCLPLPGHPRIAPARVIDVAVPEDALLASQRAATWVPVSMEGSLGMRFFRGSSTTTGDPERISSVGTPLLDAEDRRRRRRRGDMDRNEE